MSTDQSSEAVPLPFRRVPGLRISNVWLYQPGREETWLIDCGHRAERRALLIGLGRLGVEPGELTGVVLTHRHSDHAGNARFLQERFGVSVLAHREDADVLEGRAVRPTMERSGGTRIAGFLGRIENRWPAAAPRIERGLEDGEEVCGLEVHWIPGHTRGSVFLRHDTSGALVTGDSLLTAEPPLVLRSGLFLAYCSFTEDLKAAHDGVAAFHEAGVPYSALLPGHGAPRGGAVRDDVLRMLGQSPK
jgi:glyoxylase-like metal-dependent hydrolase (beta-lactamase superfamily II)